MIINCERKDSHRPDSQPPCTSRVLSATLCTVICPARPPRLCRSPLLPQLLLLTVTFYTLCLNSKSDLTGMLQDSLALTPPQGNYPVSDLSRHIPLCCLERSPILGAGVALAPRMFLRRGRESEKPCSLRVMT